MKSLPLALFALIAFGASPAVAQDQASAPAPVDQRAFGDSVTIGVAAVNLPDYEGSNDSRWVPAPAALGTVHGMSFQLAGNRASLDLIPNPKGPGWDVQVGPLAVVNFNRTSTKSISDPRIKALGKLDTAIELGGYVGIGKTGLITSPYDKLSVSVSYRYDVAGAHKSGIIQPSVNYFTPLSRKAAVGLFASAERVQQGYADAYFTVTPAGSLASGLPAYRAHSGWKSYMLGALGTVSLTGDLLHGWKLFGGGTYKRLLNSFADSPVVSIAGSRNQWLGAAGIGYTF